MKQKVQPKEDQTKEYRELHGVLMSRNEIIIATLEAQIIINKARAKSLRQWVYNQSNLLKADVLDGENEILIKEIKTLSK